MTKNLSANRWVRSVLAAAVLVAFVALLETRFGHIPALGRFLDPFAGIWAKTLTPLNDARSDLAIPGLSGKVEINVDKDRVIHIFAENDDDLYAAQGFAVASERLWQMEFLVRLASGRLSEVVGERGLNFDRFFIKSGIADAAVASSKLMLADPLTGPAIRAYVRGVNAFVDGVTVKNRPFEYKLLDLMPRKWTEQDVAYLLKFMAYNLSGHSYDLGLSRSRAALSAEDFEQLFPLSLGMPEPIVPKSTKWAFEARAPEKPDQEFLVDLKKLDRLPSPNPANGSNNWAVTGKKSSTGLPILSNDIHLGLSLPSLWYEMQLVSPTQNVYGIALPGAPGVILGFNQKLAWGVTNGGTDILDYYDLRYRDEKKSEYLFDGLWRPVISREVEVKIRDRESEKMIIRETHFGPIVYDETEIPLSPLIPKGLAMRWGALEPSNELRSFLLLNRAKSTKECRDAIDAYHTPDQNFLCADNANDVGLWHMGRYPVRWRGQGRMISDGTNSAYEWKGWIPREELPFVRNPERGYLSSANQAPTDESYPHYLGWPFEEPYRGMRINELLQAKKKLTPEDLVKMQGDTLSIPARMAAPILIAAAVAAGGLTEEESRVIESLRKWDFHYDETSVDASIFDSWFYEFRSGLWSSRFGNGREMMWPPTTVTFRVMTDETLAKWFDDPSTEAKETLTSLALASLRKTLVKIKDEMKTDDVSQWAWGRVRPTNFPHISRIPGLGRTLAAGGSANSIFANHGEHGPVWKVVVALGKRPKAWGLFPGGQSGDPSSPHYDEFLEPWRKNEMKELVYLLTPEEENPRFSHEFLVRKEAQ